MDFECCKKCSYGPTWSACSTYDKCSLPLREAEMIIEELLANKLLLGKTCVKMCRARDDWRGGSGKNCPYRGKICPGDPEFGCGKDDE